MRNAANELSFNFYGAGYRSEAELTLEIYNLKGQKLFTKKILPATLTDGKLGINWEGHPCGVYLAKIRTGKGVIKTKRFSNL